MLWVPIDSLQSMAVWMKHMGGPVSSLFIRLLLRIYSMVGFLTELPSLASHELVTTHSSRKGVPLKVITQTSYYWSKKITNCTELWVPWAGSLWYKRAGVATLWATHFNTIWNIQATVCPLATVCCWCSRLDLSPPAGQTADSPVSPSSRAVLASPSSRTFRLEWSTLTLEVPGYI